VMISQMTPATAGFVAVPAEDLAARVARLGGLPQAPLAMPKQPLEHEVGLLRRLLRLSQISATRTEG
jgi:hypothetical protein